MENTNNGVAPAVSDETNAETLPAGESAKPEDLTTVKAKLDKSVQAEKNLRARLREAEAAEAKLKEIETANLTETEKLKKQLAEVETAKTQAEKSAQRARAQVVASGSGYEPEAAALWLDTQPLEAWDDDAIKTALVGAPAWVKAQAQGVTTAPTNPARQGEKTISRTTFDRMAGSEQAAYIKGGGKLTD